MFIRNKLLLIILSTAISATVVAQVSDIIQDNKEEIEINLTASCNDFKNDYQLLNNNLNNYYAGSIDKTAIITTATTIQDKWISIEITNPCYTIGKTIKRCRDNTTAGQHNILTSTITDNLRLIARYLQNENNEPLDKVKPKIDARLNDINATVNKFCK